MKPSKSLKDSTPISKDEKMKPVKSGDYQSDSGSESDDEEGKAAKDFVKSNYKKEHTIWKMVLNRQMFTAWSKQKA